MFRGKKLVLVVGALTMLGVGGGAAAGVGGSGGPLQRDAVRDGSGADFSQVVQGSGATPSEVARVTRALRGVHLLVDGHEIPAYGIAMGVFMRRAATDLDSDPGVRLALVRTMSQLALESALYDDGRNAGLTGPSAAELRKVEDDETEAIVKDRKSPFPSVATARAYFHSAAFARSYSHDIVVKLDRERITHTGDVLTPRESLRADRLIESWALTQFPHRVKVEGDPYITSRDLALAVI